MERRGRQELVEVERRSHSGTFRAISPQVIEELERDMKASAVRVDRLRATVMARHGEDATAVDADDLALQALQEVDAAYEELRIAEEELYAQADQLLSNHASYERERRASGALFELAPEAYLVTDQNGAIVQANRRAGVLLNVESSLLVRKPLVSLVAHEDRLAFFDLIAGMGDTVFRAQLRVNPRGDSERVWVALSAQRVPNDAQTTRIHWLLRPINDERAEHARQVAVEQQLRNRIRQLEEKAVTGVQESTESSAASVTKKESYVLAEVAHELRSPLGTIAGWLHMLSGGSETPLVQRAVTGMTRSVRLLARLVDDLIEHSRLNNAQVVLKPEMLNLLRVVIAVVEDTRPLAELKQIRFELVTKHHKIDVKVDATRLEQVFRNIIGNAIKFTSPQGVIRVSITIVGQHAEVAISDTGRGIPRDALDKIFDPFVQLGTPGTRHTGLGLGLGVARNLLELHGGSIVAHSDGPGSGATFRIRLPIVGLN